MSAPDGNDLLVILCTAPDDVAAEKLGRGLVDARLAACVNAVPGVRSFYRWQGKVEADAEVQLVIKTRKDRFDAVAAWLKANHPYEVPEIVALPAERVSAAYLEWVIGETS